MREREILQISLGSPACEVSSHLLNLQGLAATTDEDEAPYCQAGVTHAVTNRLRVPRALWVDAPAHMHRQYQQPSAATASTTGFPAAENHKRLRPSTAAWSGQVEELSIHALTSGHDSSLAPSWQQKGDPWQVQSWQETSNVLATSQFSRYRVADSFANSRSPPPTYMASSTNSRHVDWDDLGDEKDEDNEEESEQERRERMQRQRRQWQGTTFQPLQAQLENTWNTILQEPSTETAPPAGSPENATKESIRPDELLWTDYLAPPFHPRSILSSPAFQDDAYFPVASGKSSSTWIEDEMLERIRNMLEDCDACQGYILSTSGFGIFAGLATQVLQFLQDECPSTSRIVLSFEESKKIRSSPSPLQENSQQHESDWRSHYIETTREDVNKATAWYDFLESSNAILPLQLQVGQHPSRFHASAALAAALEATTLPFRVRPNERLRLGMNSYYYGSFSGDSNFGSVPGLSLSEFLGVVKPRDRLSVLELDALSISNSEPLWPILLEGTSVEHDRRMRESPHLAGHRRPRDVLPGRWLLGGDEEGGRLTSLSMTDATNRSLHTHFSLASAVRPSTVGAAPLNHYVDCLMQGMGIQFRPEQSAATVLDQSLASLAEGGYGAGSYWKTVWKNRPVLAVVGNTTRFYPKAHSMASNLKKALSPRSRGFYNRDVSNGMLPEIEDCQDALSYMWDLRDLYQPPEGSGLVVDEDGEYVDW